jgi:hypothetical protein
MNGQESRLALAERVAAAAGAAWGCFVIGVGLQVVAVAFYYGVVFIPDLAQFVRAIWQVDSTADVRGVMFVWLAAWKVCLLLWLMGCVFLSLWARRLRRAGRA